MKIRNLVAGSLQNAGLRVINALARSGRYRVYTDVPYGADDRNRLDYYIRTDTAEDPVHARPLVLFFYGGNWQSGRRQDYRFVADTLCKMGCDVIVPDYRLYPEVRFSGIIDDVSLAATWLFQNKQIDPGRPIFIMGHSAGAQLGSLLCLNQALLSHIDAVERRIAGFIGLSGPYDFYPYTEESHWDLFSPERAYPNSQAVNFVRAGGPPLYLLHGKEDSRVRRGHSKSLMEKQIAAGGDASREVYEGVGHVDMVVSFSVFHRRKSQAVKDVENFILRSSKRHNNCHDNRHTSGD